MAGTGSNNSPVSVAVAPGTRVAGAIEMILSVGVSLTVRLKAWFALPAALLAVAVKALIPPVPGAGVPLTTPDVALSVSPDGKPGSA